MDETQASDGERLSAPQAVEERVTDEAAQPGDDEITVQAGMNAARTASDRPAADGPSDDTSDIGDTGDATRGGDGVTWERDGEIPAVAADMDAAADADVAAAGTAAETGVMGVMGVMGMTTELPAGRASGLALSEPGPDAPTLPGYSGELSHPLVDDAPTYAPAAGADSPTAPSLPVVVPPNLSPHAAHGPTFRLPSGTTSPLARPFPPLVTALVGSGAFVLVCLAYVLTELAGRADWADGARVAGVVALILAGVSLLAAGLRYALGRRAVATVALAGVLAASLGAGGGVALAASPSLHRAQAQTLERDHQWDAAALEYKLAGERAPNAPDVARLLDESGEAQLAQGRYAPAIAAFNAVLGQYGQSTEAVSSAYKDLFSAYAKWVQAGGATVPYADAAAFFSAYRHNALCDTACAKDASDMESQARYQYGQALTAKKQYSDAIAQYEIVTGQLPGASYASKAHAAAAGAYLTLAQQTLQQECSAPLRNGDSVVDSLALYQTLAGAYGDSPEGKQAKTALAAPQTVTGIIYQAPTNPGASVYLSKSINPGAFYFTNDYKASLDGSGRYTFTNVAQGTYYLDIVRDLGYATDYQWLVGGDNKPYPIKVGPLCGTDVGYFYYNG